MTKTILYKLRNQEIAQEYHRGQSLAQVANKFGLSFQRISQILCEQGLSPTKYQIKQRQQLTQRRNFQIIWNDDLDNALCLLRGAGHGNRVIGEQMGFSEPTISKRVKFLGLPPGTPFTQKDLRGIIL